MTVHVVSTGRPRRRLAPRNARGASTAICADTVHSMTTATAGGRFVLSKGSPKSERSKRIEFFNFRALETVETGLTCFDTK